MKKPETQDYFALLRELLPGREITESDLERLMIKSTCDPDTLAGVWQREVDGAATRAIRSMTIVSLAAGWEMARSALEAGATPQVVREALNEPKGDK